VEREFRRKPGKSTGEITSDAMGKKTGMPGKKSGVSEKTGVMRKMRCLRPSKISFSCNFCFSVI
jgi:hypothetical protein